MAWIRLYLQIRDKAGCVVPFSPNEVQVRFFRLIASLMKAGQPVRVDILKGRQMGISTVIQGINFAVAWQNPQTNALTAAHELKATRELFRKQRNFLNSMPKDELHRIEHHNRLEIVFEQPHGSQMTTSTAQGKNLGTSTTLNFFHGSEVAKWGADANEQLLSVMQAIPNLPNTFVFLESTAHGVGGAFYDHWAAACLAEDDPNWNHFQPLFLPWVLDSSYSLPAGPDFVRTPAEEEIVRRGAIFRAGRQIERIEITNEQLAWRRFTIPNKCGNDVETFRQEYPFTPEEAFITTGSKRFNNTILTRWLPDCVRGEKLRLNMDSIRPGARPFFDSLSPLEVWERPRPGESYTIGADPSGGMADGDYSAAVVLHTPTRRVVALFRARMEPLFFAEQLNLLGRWYNNALLAPETNMDISVVSSLTHDLNYPNVYLQRRQDSLGRPVGEKPGWNSNRKTKPLVIDSLADHIEREEVGIQSAVVIDELLRYERHEDGTVGAPVGRHNHDDTVIALAIAAYLADECPVYIPLKRKDGPDLRAMHPSDREAWLVRHSKTNRVEVMNCAD